MYFVQSATALSGLLHFSAGGRWDRDSIDGRAVLLPQASIALAPAQSTRFQLAWGEYAQYPDVAQLTSNLGNRGLLPARTGSDLDGEPGAASRRTCLPGTNFTTGRIAI